MKKILFTLAICTFFVNMAKAECWGNEATGQNGHTYCASKQDMNWYSAFAWCHAQGRHLVTMNELCDYGDAVWGKNQSNCMNFKIGQGTSKRGDSWSVNIDDDGKAYMQLNNAYVVTTPKPKTDKYKACCY